MGKVQGPSLSLFAPLCTQALPLRAQQEGFLVMSPMGACAWLPGQYDCSQQPQLCCGHEGAWGRLVRASGGRCTVRWGDEWGGAEALSRTPQHPQPALFSPHHSPACNPNVCRASGRGLQPKGVRVKEVADFKVFTKGAGSGELKVTVKGPSECQSPG